MKAKQLLPVLAASAFTLATPHELENVKLNEEVSDSFVDERVNAVLGGHELHLIFELEHQLTAHAPFTPHAVVEIVANSSFPNPMVSFSGVSMLRGDEVEQLETLLRQGGYYTVRAKGDPSDASAPFVLTSVPICMLVARRLREDMAFHLSDSGKLVALEYLTPYVDPDSCSTYQIQSLEDARFDPVGTVLTAQTGPSPPKNIVVKHDRAPQGVTPIKSEEGIDESEKENQSFLRKYWYIILPIVVMSLMGGDGGAAPAGGAAAPATRGRRR
ncbi:hypothetical protein PsorP6_014467 [Peronosclerospora sorghi]|uniref:Uncharacterized protein n=1 Tax=Peronosclerospora sorghi TaxID=230839 RepID=A0ACC0VRS0_9STRA|nr:hypothetical protein PsorP6_014467 [Peronosclerospora sorghi]